MPARRQLFCFPHAGAGSSAFRAWVTELPETANLAVVTLPARERRFKELPVTTIEDLMGALVPVLEDVTDASSIFFGHSLGALLAFEAARRLQLRGAAGPGLLVVSSRRPPHRRQSDTVASALSREDLRALVRRLGGTPEALLENDEMFDILAVAFRADFALAESYVYKSTPLLEVPIRSLVGKDDPNVTAAEMAAWSDLTGAGADLIELAGDHFLIWSRPRDVVRAIFAQRPTQGGRSTCS